MRAISYITLRMISFLFPISSISAFVLTFPSKNTQLLSHTSITTAVPSTPITIPSLQSKFDQLISHPVQLFIEDTDAYQVKYNGNYIRSYERALFQIAEEVKHIVKSSVLSDENFVLLGVTKHKFKSSPRLGDKFQVLAKRLENTCDNTEEWQLEMIRYQNDSSDTYTSRSVFNTATVTIAKFNSIK